MGLGTYYELGGKDWLRSFRRIIDEGGIFLNVLRTRSVGHLKVKSGKGEFSWLL